jgi:hypothetical protein
LVELRAEADATAQPISYAAQRAAKDGKRDIDFGDLLGYLK